MKQSNIVNIGSVPIGGEQFSIIAGPCSIESYSMLREVAFNVQQHGACILRGGVYKIRTSPQTFQGLGNEALEHVDKVKKEMNMPFVVEITDASQIEQMYSIVDAFQVGTRNMHNTYLLKALGKTDKPIILKRGMSAYLKEWIGAAEYIAQEGNQKIILCERGVRSFDKETRNMLDLSGAVWAKLNSPYPVIVDPSHATGLPELIPAMCKATVACGLDGIMVEVHPRPTQALSDGFQALTYESFGSMVTDVQKLLPCLGRSLS